MEWLAIFSISLAATIALYWIASKGDLFINRKTLYSLLPLNLAQKAPWLSNKKITQTLRVGGLSGAVVILTHWASLKYIFSSDQMLDYLAFPELEYWSSSEFSIAIALSFLSGATVFYWFTTPPGKPDMLIRRLTLAVRCAVLLFMLAISLILFPPKTTDGFILAVLYGLPFVVAFIAATPFEILFTIDEEVVGKYTLRETTQFFVNLLCISYLVSIFIIVYLAPSGILGVFGSQITSTPLEVVWFIWAIVILLSASYRRSVFAFAAVVGICIGAIIFSSFGTRDVRLAQDGAPSPASIRKTQDVASTDGPIFLIVADGGGVRAAYWTTAVLTRIAERFPDFAKQIRAMGGASGGSVGIGVFSALMQQEPDAPSAWREHAKKVLAADYLAAIANRLLWWDWFIPPGVSPTDRAIVLEKQLEQSFASVTGADDGLSRAFESVTGPHLFMNLTEASSGRPYILMNEPLTFSTERYGPHPPVALSPTGLNLSTAMVLSARFPFISPAGRAIITHEEIDRARFATGEEIDQLKYGGHPDGVWGKVSTRPRIFVDGGYADNSGSLGVQAYIENYLEDKGAEALMARENVFVISIINDYERGGPDTEEYDAALRDVHAKLNSTCETQDPAGKGVGADSKNAIFGPLATLNGVRTRSSERERLALSKIVPEGHYAEVHLRLCDGERAPLGWTLSEASRDAMDRSAEAAVGQPKTPLRPLLCKAFPNAALCNEDD